eukprot:TRINITY_DN9907_c0_g1_i1.p1 TRINITY_DN9907_c0_g1~~TRINITY_DN9907_c0_g1_i1.p1  ORF type:complete len:789 (-),score=190.72 TRINITY_DN9907_c0_g1_i1:28-2367(-)
MEGDKMQVDAPERPVDDSVNDSMQGVEGMAAPGKNVLTMGDVPPHPEVPPKIDEFQNAVWRRPGDQEAEHKAFYEHLEQFMNSRGTVMARLPQLGHKELDLHRLYCEVIIAGGLHSVINKKYWKKISEILELPKTCTNAGFTLRFNYMKYLYAYELHYYYGLEDDKRDWTPSRAPLTKRTVDPEKKKQRELNKQNKKRKREDGDGSDEDSDAEGEDVRPDWYGGDDDSDDEYGRPKGQKKKKRRSRSPKRWYPKKDRVRKPPELGPDGLPIKKDKKKKKQEWVWEEEPDYSQTKVPPGYNSIPVGTRDLSRTPHPAMSDRLLARGGEGLDMNHVLAQLFTNSREDILAALNTLQRRSYDPDFDLTQYPLALDHLMVVARNVWITVSQQDAAPFSKNGQTPFVDPSPQELLSANRAGLMNLPDFADGPVQVLISILNVLRNWSFGATCQPVLANHILLVDFLINILLMEAVYPPHPSVLRRTVSPSKVLNDIARRSQLLKASRTSSSALTILLSCKPDVDSVSTKENIYNLALETLANIVHLVRFSTLPLPSADGSSDFKAADNEGQLTEAGLMIKRVIPKLISTFVPAPSVPTSDASEQFALEAVTIIATNPHSRVLFSNLMDEDPNMRNLLSATCDKLSNMILLEEHKETRFWAACGLQSLMDTALDPHVVIHMCQSPPFASDTLVVALEKNTQKMIRELALGASLLDDNDAVAARDLATIIAITLTRMCSVVDVHPSLLLYEDRLVSLSLGCPRGTLAERLSDLVTTLLNTRTEDNV